MKMNNKYCQSCGMPMKKDTAGGGTNADGSLNKEYCSHCYQKGNFTKPEITVVEMQTLVKNKMKEMGFPCFLAVFFTKAIPKLNRWK